MAGLQRKWAGLPPGVQTNSGRDNPSLKIPRRARHPAEAFDRERSNQPPPPIGPRLRPHGCLAALRTFMGLWTSHPGSKSFTTPLGFISELLKCDYLRQRGERSSTQQHAANKVASDVPLDLDLDPR